MVRHHYTSIVTQMTMPQLPPLGEITLHITPVFIQIHSHIASAHAEAVLGVGVRRQGRLRELHHAQRPGARGFVLVATATVPGFDALSAHGALHESARVQPEGVRLPAWDIAWFPRRVIALLGHVVQPDGVLLKKKVPPKTRG